MSNVKTNRKVIKVKVFYFVFPLWTFSHFKDFYFDKTSCVSCPVNDLLLDWDPAVEDLCCSMW